MHRKGTIMNIGRAFLVQSGMKQSVNHATNTDHTLYTRLQWLITYKGTDHPETIEAQKKYDVFCKAYAL